jgi:hypothetical protein
MGNYSSRTACAKIIFLFALLTGCTSVGTQPDSRVGLSPQPISPVIATVTPGVPEIVTTAIQATPTPTLTPTRTPVPEFVGVRPQTFGVNDYSVMVGDIRFQVADSRRLERAGNSKPNTGQQYLLVEGYVYNYGDPTITLHDIDFDLIFAAGEEIVSRVPDTGLLDAFKNSERPNLVYPDRNIPLYPDYHVSSGMIRPIALIYEVPLDVNQIRIAFLQDQPNLSLLLLESDSPSFIIYKTDLVAQEYISLVLEDDALRGFYTLFEQDVVVDNCFGTTDLARTFEFSQQASARLELGAPVESPVNPLSLDLIETRVRDTILAHHGIPAAQLEPVVYTRSEVVSAAPATKPRWQFVWLQDTIEGIVNLQLGDDLYRLPYTVYGSVSYELRSIPTEGCTG